MAVIDDATLRFTVDEAASLVRSAAVAPDAPDSEAGSPSAADLAELCRLTQGWAAGLLLLVEWVRRTGALPMGTGTGWRPASPDGSTERLFRESRYELLFDYFAAEVLDRVDAATRRFLLESALLPDLTAERATARDRLAQRFRQAVLQLGQGHQAAGRWERGIALYERALRADDRCEAFYQGLMRCFAALGRRADVVATYERCARTLRAALGAEPSGETARLCRQASS